MPSLVDSRCADVGCAPQIIVYLVQQWLTSDTSKAPCLNVLSFSMTDSLELEKSPNPPTVQSPSYQIINSQSFLLRERVGMSNKRPSYERLATGDQAWLAGQMHC